MTLKAQICPRFRPKLAVRIMASRAIHAGGAADLVGMSDFGLSRHVGVATITNMRRQRAHLVGIRANRCVVIRVNRSRRQ